MKKMLVIGIGNIGRGDDGLGWAFIDRMADDERFDAIKKYQLQVEDAELIAGYDTVWFVDASHTRYEEGLACEELEPVSEFCYTSHALHPAAVLHLCNDLYNCHPSAFLLGISGDDWELGDTISKDAQERLNRALNLFQNFFELKQMH